MHHSLQSLRWPSQLQINAVLASSSCRCSAPPLLQLSASEKSATICLLSTDNCHWNVRLQTAVTFIAASLTCECSKETNRSDSKWLLALLGNAVKQQELGRLHFLGGVKLRNTGAPQGGDCLCSPASRISYQCCFWQVRVWRSFSSLPAAG